MDYLLRINLAHGFLGLCVGACFFVLVFFPYLTSKNIANSLHTFQLGIIKTRSQLNVGFPFCRNSNAMISCDGASKDEVKHFLTSWEQKPV